MKRELVLSIAFALFSAVVASTHEYDEVRIPAGEQGHELNTEDDATGEEVVYENDQGGLLKSIQLNATSKEAASSENWAHHWTHQPVCTEILEALGSELCVYTNATFSHGRGISIFTTPRIAEEIAALLPFHDDEAHAKHGINDAEGPWYTKALPGKGVGMLAKRDLKRGDLITAYTPYLLAHTENILATLEREKFLQIAVSQLPEASQERYYELARYYHEPSVAVQDIIKANTFEVQVGGQVHLMVVPEPSRYNHACAPK